MSVIGRVEVGIRHDLLEPIGHGDHLGGGGIPAGMARVTSGYELARLVSDLVREGEARPLALADPRRDLQEIVELGGLDVLYECLDHRHGPAADYLRHPPGAFTQR